MGIPAYFSHIIKNHNKTLSTIDSNFIVLIVLKIIRGKNNIIKINYELDRNNFNYLKLNKDNIESSLLYSYLV